MTTPQHTELDNALIDYREDVYSAVEEARMNHDFEAENELLKQIHTRPKRSDLMYLSIII